MKIKRKLRRFGKAWASVFCLYPRTDYWTMYPYRSAEQRMEDAWARTMLNLNNAIAKFDAR
jgi:hypothetical protein